MDGRGDFWRGQRVVVTGATGMLGAEFVARLEEDAIACVALSRPRANLDEPASLAKGLLETPGSVVIHCAAETNVDACEEDPAMAQRRNHEATLVLAQAAHTAGAKFVFISSSGIFDGRRKAPYDEFVSPSPLTTYARSKVDAENALREKFPDALIVRAGWLFGGATSQRKNFVAARCREAVGEAEIVSAFDKVGSPTWTRDLVDLVLRLGEVGASGVVHTVNSGAASRAEYVAEILRLAGSSTKVRAVSSQEFPRRAPVPDNESLTSVRLGEWGLAPLRSWQEALAEYIGGLDLPGQAESLDAKPS